MSLPPEDPVSLLRGGSSGGGGTLRGAVRSPPPGHKTHNEARVLGAFWMPFAPRPSAGSVTGRVC